MISRIWYRGTGAASYKKWWRKVRASAWGGRPASIVRANAGGKGQRVGVGVGVRWEKGEGCGVRWGVERTPEAAEMPGRADAFARG